MGTPDAGQNIITRGLPKTGQTTQYQAGDDGNYEAGWWKGRLNANNRTRFIARTIGGDDVVLDRATGLMWAADGNAAGCNNGALITWANAIIYANGLTFATFSDWRVPNATELWSIVDAGAGLPRIYQAFFPNTVSNDYWTSTTTSSDILRGQIVTHASPGIHDKLKTDTCYLRCVRKGL